MRLAFTQPAVLLGAALLLAASAGAVQYTQDGKMALPDYRQWVFLTSGLNMTYDPAAGSSANPRFENVFVNPEAYQAFLKTGSWPDETVLILEARASGSKVSINRDGRVQTDLIAVEAHVKDASRGGWAFYAFGKSKVGDRIPKTADCYSCHEQHGAVDTTFVQFYPTLIEIARGKGTYNNEKP